MKSSRIVSIIYIITGGIIALYAQADVKQNQLILIIGIVLLMLGLYRISRGIPSKSDNDQPQEHIEDDV